jgi:hypothetical protein
MMQVINVYPMDIPKSELKTLAEGILKLYNDEAVGFIKNYFKTQVPEMTENGSLLILLRKD